MAVSARWAMRRNSFSLPGAAKNRKPFCGRPMFFRDARCPRQHSLDGAVHGHGPGRRHRGGALLKTKRAPRELDFHRCAILCGKPARFSPRLNAMPFLRTVLGDIGAAQAGICYAHEHLIIDPSFTTYCIRISCSIRSNAPGRRRGFLSRRVAARWWIPCLAAAGATSSSWPKFRGARWRTLFALPGCILRNIMPPGHWGERLGVEQLAELFIADIEQGIDAADYNGPEIARTQHKAGVIKVATGQKIPSAHERNVIEAAASRTSPEPARRFSRIPSKARERSNR